MWVVPIYHDEMIREFISKKKLQNSVVTSKCKLWTKDMTDIATNYSGEDGIGARFGKRQVGHLGFDPSKNNQLHDRKNMKIIDACFLLNGILNGFPNKF